MRRLVAASAQLFACCLAGLLLQVACGSQSLLAAEQHGLNDRIAELEATAAPSGSRPLPLNIYGQVNRAVLFEPGYAAGCGQVEGR